MAANAAREVVIMRTLSVQDFHAELKAQGVRAHEDSAFKCPMCRTIQSARDLIAAGAGETFKDVERFLGFSCVGRWTDAGPYRRGDAPGRGCDWTLGGLLKIHDLVVIADGIDHPRFELASPEEAQAHARSGLEFRTRPFSAAEERA
jgi:hypothetical protein